MRVQKEGEREWGQLSQGMKLLNDMILWVLLPKDLFYISEVYIDKCIFYFYTNRYR